MNISQYTGQLYPSETLLKPARANDEQRAAQAAADARASGEENKTPTDLGNEIFNTLVETVNPLQHIPGVSTAYRAITGETINPVASLAGGWLFGGPVGLAAGAASSFLELVTGKSLAANAMALFSGSSSQHNARADVKTASIGDGGPMLQPEQNLGLKQYQAFAKTTAAKHQGTGASQDNVAWSSGAWTTQALRQAVGAYEANQNRMPGATKHENRIA